jgi:predicted ATPase with chaperone activity
MNRPDTEAYSGQEPEVPLWLPEEPVAEEPVPVEKEAGFVPSAPERLEELEVSPAFLADLALKTLSLDPEGTTSSIAARMRLGMIITEALLQRLYRDKLIEIKGMIGMHHHRYAVLDRGWTEINRMMKLCSYVGPAPVSLKSYTETIVDQVRSRPPVEPEMLQEAVRGLVLSDSVRETLGLVISSSRSLFLNGPSGNGKTAMATALVKAIGGHLWIPYAIEVDGQVIRVFDTHNHHPLPHPHNNYDRRWVKIRPPLVVVGGELTIQNLDLISTDTQRFYEAPFQVKSNGGVLVVDDLGRQRCSPKDLLNRWIIPLENRVDYLTLSTGKKIQMPFEQIVVFATNLTSSDIEDEAFLRRMGYRLEVTAPDEATYRRILADYAASQKVTYDDNVVEHLWNRYRIEHREPKRCDPRDLVDRCLDICKLRRQPFHITVEIADTAWNNYFGKPPRIG